MTSKKELSLALKHLDQIATHCDRDTCMCGSSGKSGWDHEGHNFTSEFDYHYSSWEKKYGHLLKDKEPRKPLLWYAKRLLNWWKRAPDSTE